MHIILDKTAASKLYKTLLAANYTGNIKHHFKGISGIKPIKNTPKNTSSNKVTTPAFLTVACAVAIEEASK